MICEPLSTDLGVLAEMYEEYHLLRCRTSPDLFRPPFEDSFYFSWLSEILLYSDEEVIVSVDEETDFIKGFAVFGVKEEESPIQRKRKVCKIDLLIVRRSYEESGTDSELVEFISNYAVENGCVSIEYGTPANNVAICNSNGFEPKEITMELKLK